MHLKNLNKSPQMIKLFIYDKRFQKQKYLESIFCRAIGCGYIDLVKLLIKDFQIDIGCGENSAIVIAASEGRLELVKLLLNLGADPTVQNNLALRRAYQYKHSEVCKFLLDQPLVVLSIYNMIYGHYGYQCFLYKLCCSNLFFNFTEKLDSYRKEMLLKFLKKYQAGELKTVKK